MNETAGARPWGAVVNFDFAGFSNQVGGWISGGDDSWGGWPDFDSNASFSFNTAYEIFEGTDFRLDYVFNDNGGGTESSRGNADRSYASAYQHGFAVGTDSEFGQLGLITNFIWGWNRNGSGGLPDKHDTWGLVVMPYYDVTEKIQAVFRWAYMSDGREQRTARFDRRVAVSNYHTFYGGINYKICGDKLKLMAGYEYAPGDTFSGGDDIDTSSWQFAVRTYF